MELTQLLFDMLKELKRFEDKQERRGYGKLLNGFEKKKTEISETKLCQIHLREIFNRLYLAEERIISYLEGKAEETFPEYITESQR